MSIRERTKSIVSYIMVIVMVSTFLLAVMPTQAKAYTVEPQKFSGSLSSANDTYTVNVTVDYSLVDTYYLYLTRTGTSGFTTKVLDQSGNTLNTTTINSMNDKVPGSIDWCAIPNPTSATGAVTYTIKVSTDNFDSDCSFHLAVGSYNDAEELLSGQCNAVPVAKYGVVKDVTNYPNQVMPNLIPNKYEQWYKFTAQSLTNISILSKNKGVRFRIEDLSNNIKYDSNDDSSAHKTWQSAELYYIERAKLTSLNAGNQYYCVVYIADSYKQNVSTPITQLLNIAIGGPRLSAATSRIFYASSSVTGTSSAYSGNAKITVSGLPASATVYKINFKANGVAPSDLNYWRYRPSTTTIWTVVGPFRFLDDVNYTYEGNSNKLANGTWYVGTKASSSKRSLTCTPGISFCYYYEIGD